MFNMTTTLNKLIKERPSQLVLDIREAIIEEYNEHETCGYDIGCIVTSKTLTDKLDKILSKSIQSGYELAIKDVMELECLKEEEDSVYECYTKSECNNELREEIKLQLQSLLKGYENR